MNCTSNWGAVHDGWFFVFVISLSVEDKTHSERSVLFYNWLIERDSHPQSIVQCEPALKNWRIRV